MKTRTFVGLTVVLQLQCRCTHSKTPNWYIGVSMTFEEKLTAGWSIQESSRNAPRPDLERLRAQQITRFSLDSLDPQTKLRTGNKSHSSSEVLSFLGGSVDRDVQAGYTRLFLQPPFPLWLSTAVSDEV